MTRLSLLAGLALLSLGGAAFAQETGGLRSTPGSAMGHHGLARPMQISFRNPYMAAMISRGV